MLTKKISLSFILITTLCISGCKNGDQGLLGGGPDSGGPDRIIEKLEVTSTNDVIPIGFSSQMRADVFFDDGTSTQVTSQVEWVSSDPSIITVDNNGKITGVAAGEASIEAQVQHADVDFIDSQNITVVNTSITKFHITPTSGEIVQGNTRDYQAWVIMSDGSVYEATEQSQIEWGVGPEGVARVIAPGVIEGVQIGETTVTASGEINNTPFNSQAKLEVVVSSLPVSWGDQRSGGNMSYAELHLINQTVSTVLGKDGNFCAFKENDSAVCWGSNDSSAVQQQLTNMQPLGDMNHWSVALVKIDGTVVNWGSPSLGGDSSNVQDQLTDVIDIQEADGAYAALKKDGTVVTWGDPEISDASAVQDQLKDITDIVTSNDTFAALKGNGTVVTWGGDASDISTFENQLINVESIIPNQGLDGNGFAIIKEDRTALSWGENGINSQDVQGELTDIKIIKADEYGFAALKYDGTVIRWGKQTDYPVEPSEALVDVKNIITNGEAWIAIKNDGNPIFWGNELFGGSGPSEPLNDIEQICADNNRAFAVIKRDGTVISWGLGDIEGHINWGGDSSEVQDQLKNVVDIVGNGYDGSFAALKSDGTVVTWGAYETGGDSSDPSVAPRLKNVSKIFANGNAYVAIK